ncbi:TPA: hypothetical protein N0F65_002037 [Lagenidium giganteum]|uniref:Uncharacterized protein n=1 Tax=Lagenidium giganteum TaxID=4803 RepID=A0AAV2Z380_9STRA|nr:TPA: hypothetical protein N0F65_002037 [Lagenidium giganteum]
MPLLVLAPYWRDFNVGEYVFPIEVEYNDAFFAGLTSESQIIATGTVKGLLLRLVPHLSVLSSCFAIHEFVVTSATDIVHPMRPPSLAVKPHRHAKKPLWRKVVDSLFGAVGLVVLVIHIQTYVHQSTHPDDPLCSLPMAPWFATKFACKFACAVYTFDCSHFQRSSPLPGDLSFLEETALIKLNFAHCSALVVPRDIQRFPSMIGITIKHLTLVEWSRDAALTPEHHPSFTFVGFADTNLTEIPAGLLGTLPPLLQDIEFSHTNLTTIPDDLSHFWENVTTLYFEFSGVSTIPPSLMQLQLFDLSLVGNNVTDASVLSALSPSIGYVSLDYNPLSVLPASFDVGSDVLVFEFSSEHTLVRTVTTELLSSIQTLYLLDTPYCAEASDVKPGVECNRSFFGSDGKCYFP